MRIPLLRIIVPFVMTILIVEYEIMDNENLLIFSIFIFFFELIRMKLIRNCTIQKIIILIINLILVSNFLLKDQEKQKNPTLKIPKREITLKIKFSEYFKRTVTDYGISYYASGIVLEAPKIKKEIIGKEIMCQFKDNEISNIRMFKETEICGLLVSYKKNLYLERSRLAENNRVSDLENIKGYKVLIHDIIKNSSSDNLKIHAFLNGVILGNKSLMGEKQKRLFQLSGTLHLFAVSGLHIGFIYIILSFIFKSLRLENILRELSISIILLLYLDLVEYPPSAMRATLMILSWQVSKILYKKSKVSSTLSLSAIIILAINPAELFSVGFQLSYTVVMSIGIICNNINIFEKKNIIATYLNKSIKISYAAFIGSLVIIYDYFSIIVPGSIIINVLIIPITFLGIIVIFIHLVIFMIFDSLILLIFIEKIYLTIEILLGYLTIENIAYFEFEKNTKLFELVHYIYPFSFILYKLYFKNNILNFLSLCSIPILIILIIQCI